MSRNGTGADATSAGNATNAGGAGPKQAPLAGVSGVAPGQGVLLQGDNLQLLRGLAPESIQVAYLDPPFNTGRKQSLARRAMVRDEHGSHVGFKGQAYNVVRDRLRSYDDSFDDYWGFLEPRITEVWRVLAASGTLYLHLDYREAHYAKVMLDAIFGRECFLNEIIWAYDYGAKTNRRWPAKHDTILVYVKDPEHYYFDNAEVDREPYMAPGLVTKEKRERGKLPTDVWWHTIVATNGTERTGYPTQKPMGLVRRAVVASSRPGDWVLDCFGGSGTTGAAAAATGRRFILMDQSKEAIDTISNRLSDNLVDLSS